MAITFSSLKKQCLFEPIAGGLKIFLIFIILIVLKFNKFKYNFSGQTKQNKTKTFPSVFKIPPQARNPACKVTIANPGPKLFKIENLKKFKAKIKEKNTIIAAHIYIRSTLQIGVSIYPSKLFFYISISIFFQILTVLKILIFKQFFKF